MNGPRCTVCNDLYNNSIMFINQEEVCSSMCRVRYYNLLLDVDEELTRILEESKS